MSNSSNNQTLTISEMLKLAIACKRLTKSEAARLSGLSPAMIGRFVDGERSLSGESMDALATALGFELIEVDALEQAMAFTKELLPPEKQEVADEAFRFLNLCLRKISVKYTPNVTSQGLGPNTEKLEINVEPPKPALRAPKRKRTKRGE